MGGIGILGGTFDPPHVGHLAAARHARAKLDLEAVLLMPAFDPPHKQSSGRSGPEHRLAMCELAFADADGLAVCALEIERSGPSYTVDTLRALNASNPDTELTLIVGADMALTLPAWRAPKELLTRARLAVAERADGARAAVLDALALLDPAAPVEFLAMAPVAVSSSQVRERVAAGASIDGLVSPAVARYIAARGLYRDLPSAEDR
jgi:nicotinate-nucleotide adenylyltransferase